MKYTWNLHGSDLVMPVIATLIVFWISILLPLPDGGLSRVFVSLMHLVYALLGTAFVWLVFLALSAKAFVQ